MCEMTIASSRRYSIACCSFPTAPLPMSNSTAASAGLHQDTQLQAPPGRGIAGLEPTMRERYGSDASTSSAWSSTLTFGQTLTMRPYSSMRNVERALTPNAL